MSSPHPKASSRWPRPARPVPRLPPMWAFAVVRASRQVSDLEFRLYSVLLDFDRHGLGMFVRDPAFIADEIGCAPAHVDRLLRSLRRKGLAASTSVTTATAVAARPHSCPGPAHHDGFRPES